MKKIIKYLTLVFLTGAFAFGLAQNRRAEVRTEAAITSADVRIAVVRPSFWGTDNAQQLLRVAPTADDLANNTNITSFSIAGYTGDSYYGTSGGFTEYTADGIVFYDVPYSELVDKYVDLVRLNPAGDTRWNKTASEKFSDEFLHKIWRIWGDGKGVIRPEGNSAESRNVSNAVVNNLLYGYLTCTNSITNGYGAFKKLNDHFNLTGRTYTESDTVLDFANMSDYATGRGAGVTVNTGAKVAEMQRLYTSNIGLLSVRDSVTNDSGLEGVIIIGVLGLSSLIGYYFISKKKLFG